MSPRVAILIPSMNTFATNMALCLTDLAVYSSLRGIQLGTLNQQCSLVSAARNILTRQMLVFEPKPSHVLWIDSDMMFPQTGLERLLEHDKPVVGAFYNKRVPPYPTVGHLIDQTSDVSQGGIFRADVMPHGFVLIKREVYETLPMPWYYESYDPDVVTESDPTGMVGEDVNFSRDCVKNGIEMWCDADLTFDCAHIGEIAVPCLRPDPLTPPEHQLKLGQK